ncbi:hypothetical protein EWM64_g4276 [Hericium alpestre]|uniref:ATP-dependent DNA helicase n=1 Tax=Hericium alpestre TaxID=135208 RepID=A0A4Z0A071_9AGAM|nr:hypothetical protein EWM64_g4276 [Hericium alpestre]
MSSDGYFDDEIDSAVLNELDIIESTQYAASSSKPSAPAPSAPAGQPSHPPPARDDSDLFDFGSDIDEAGLQELDAAIEDSYQNKDHTSKPPARSNFSRVPSTGGRQTTLFGDVLENPPPANKHANKGEGSSRSGMQRSKSSGQVFRKTKQWDHTAFAKSGPRRSKSDRGKGKGRARADEEDAEEDVEFEQFPAPFVSVGPPPPMKLQPDLLAAKHWIFPLNRPKREYQYNISKHCLFENTLVALPTGLGKTFIAGVVMLNFYRWFPDGKVVFVAPTKPLVAQQVEACHQTCGIPGRDAVELTGDKAKALRNKFWQEKRVFYMTPQTLENDLMQENCDVRDIVLLVIDEAHKGTGEYAYAKVVRFLMAKNPHFRVLALTATPGGNPEAVQSIVDALHISRIEIRDEQSWDIRGYINKKKVEQHIIPMNEGIAKLRDLLAKVMRGHMGQLVKHGILYGNLDPAYFHPFRAQTAMADIHRRPDARQLSWAYPVLKKVGALARAMGYLLEASPQMCYGTLKDAAEDVGKDGKTSTSKMTNDPAFRELMRELEAQKARGFAIHPKMEILKRLVIDHFGKKMGDTDVQEVDSNGAQVNGDEQTRVMVFVSFREAVDEIVTFLNQESPLLRATKFVGQGTDKQGKKGFAQKEQLDVIRRFKLGEFNILVSTSIGEEGLDIGEIDMIVCYEAQKTPIRMLQRVGRTGRKRDGYVHVLLAEGREELNWNKAQESYAEVQQSIVKGEQLEFYGDTERLLPDHIKPEPLEMVMEIEEYNREATDKSRTANSPKGATKRKRNDDMGRNIPAGASTGFVSVADLILKQGGKKRKLARPVDLEEAGEDDDTDQEIEAGIFGPRRAATTNAATKAKKSTAKARRATSLGDQGKKGKAPAKPRKTKKTKVQIDESNLSQLGAEDSDDMAIERGLVFSSRKSDASSSGSRTPSRASSPEVPLAKKDATQKRVTNPSSPDEPLAKRRKSNATRCLNRSSSPEVPLAKETSIIDICTSSDSDSQHIPRASSPDLPLSGSLTRRQRNTTRIISPQQSTTPDPGPSSSSMGLAVDPDEDLSWLLADSDDVQDRSSPPRGNDPKQRAAADDSDIEIADAPALHNSIIDISSSPGVPEPAGPPPLSQLRRDMPPPAIPARFTSARNLPIPSDDAPECSFAVRPVGHVNKRLVHPQDTDSSPLVKSSPHRFKRLRKATSPVGSPVPVRRKKAVVQDTAVLGKVNPWIDVEASHSGDEMSGGSSDAEHVYLEEDGDRGFLKNSPATQASGSYDQFAAYRQSLLSQAPGAGPVFAGPPRRGPAWAGAGGSRRLPVSSSSPRAGDELDEYAMGSFVVDDDAEISYAQSSET